jgi:hypothetical protein
MNKVEFVKWQLEENVKKREELKIKFKEKEQEYLDEKAELESEEFKEEITGRKQFLQELQDSQKKELDELKARHKKERDKAMGDYLEMKNKVKFVLGSLKEELDSISKELAETKSENKKLNKEKGRMKDLDDVKITSHAIVQYLDRAKNMNLTKVRNEVRAKLIEDGLNIKPTTKIRDHAIVEYLVEKGVIDLEKVREDILPEKVKEVMLRDELVGSTGTFTTKDGFRVVAKNGNIVTFLPKPVKKKKKSKPFYGGKRERNKRKIRKMKL